MRTLALALAATALAVSSTASLAKVPATWDGLVLVKSKKVAALYLLPNADFRGYSQVMFDPPQVAFQKNWVQNYNDEQDSLDGEVTNTYVKNAVALAQKYLTKVFPETFGKSGITVASAPGPHVLRLGVYIVNLSVAAPDVSDSMTATFTPDAGTATFAIEARDSQTGQLLGRAIDAQAAGEDAIAMRRTYGSNVGDFENLFQTWAQISAKGFDELRSSSPIDTDGMLKR
jgi:hypothetical protein